MKLEIIPISVCREGSSDMKTDREFHEDESESLPDLEGPRVKSVTFKKCNIRDRNQQVLVLEGGVLKAVPDKDVTARGSLAT
ncbi:hypothetical protein JEQ12_013900 [Ovis aries]|uniref:Uncharacterized protein n=1 Tax=Ovis aries TaxID=9940 RepID=A0A836AK84_SHEEP|nr:hypothetical protein JEQ12_013900 [Ovis aries]